VTTTKNFNFTLIQKNEQALIIKENSNKGSISPNKKTVKFLEKDETKKSQKEIISLPDDDDEHSSNNSFFNLFCFCWSNNKKKLLKKKN
jgi:hypothetical protein